MARAKQDGFNVYHAPGERMGMFDVVVNTVPAPLLTDDFLDKISPETHFFQVASGLSGATAASFATRGIPFHPLPGLPGLCAPQNEADAMYRILLQARSQNKDESE